MTNPTQQASTSSEQRALAAFEHVSRTGGTWGARLAAIKTGELLRTKNWRIQ